MAVLVIPDRDIPAAAARSSRQESPRSAQPHSRDGNRGGSNRSSRSCHLSGARNSEAPILNSIAMIPAPSSKTASRRFGRPGTDIPEGAPRSKRAALLRIVDSRILEESQPVPARPNVDLPANRSPFPRCPKSDRASCSMGRPKESQPLWLCRTPALLTRLNRGATRSLRPALSPCRGPRRPGRISCHSQFSKYPRGRCLRRSAPICRRADPA